MILYSFPLRLGQTLLVELLVAGSCCGALCAILTRWLIGPGVDDISPMVEPEPADHVA